MQRQLGSGNPFYAEPCTLAPSFYRIEEERHSMTRRREDMSQDHFDLLPFIAVLMCTLACLLLVTMSMAAISIGPGAGEGWIPVQDSTRTSKTPILIEWDGTTALVHREGRQTPIPWPLNIFRLDNNTRVTLKDGKLVPLSPEQASQDAVLQKFLDDLEAQRTTHYALFAVRPEGFSSFLYFSNEFRRRHIDVGSEPIASGKPVYLLDKDAQP